MKEFTAQNLFKKGNLKINKRVWVTTLPTSVCFGEGKQCTDCYARNPERLFRRVYNYRERALEFTKSTKFVENVIRYLQELRGKGKLPEAIRLHEAGDFYSLGYAEKWKMIISAFPEIKFYVLTKKGFVADVFKEVKNMNVILSLTPEGYNYGDIEYCKKLIKEHNYILCPCSDHSFQGCGDSCRLCEHEKKICFLKHSPALLSVAARKGEYTKKKGAFIL